MNIAFPSPVSNFIISVWFHPDLRFQTVPPTSNSNFFLTDNHNLYYDIVSSTFKVGINTNNNSQYQTYALGDSVNYYGWNYLILANQPDGNGNTNITASLKNSFFSLNTFSTNVTGLINCSKICFCHNDIITNCCGFNNIKWMDLWYKDLKIWDGSKVNVWSIIQNYN